MKLNNRRGLLEFTFLEFVLCVLKIEGQFNGKNKFCGFCKVAKHIYRVVQMKSPLFELFNNFKYSCIPLFEYLIQKNNFSSNEHRLRQCEISKALIIEIRNSN